MDGQQKYARWREWWEGLTLDGSRMAAWDELPEFIRQAWERMKG